MNTPRAERHSRPRSPRKITNSVWAEIRTAHASGIGLRELARKMGIPPGTVLARSKREGWTCQIQQAKALAQDDTQSNAISVTQSAALTMAERGKRHVERMAGVAERVMPHVETMEAGAILDRVEDIDRLDRIARRTYGLRDGEGAGNFQIVNIALLDFEPETVKVLPLAER